jgi:hypothetical protein
MICLKSDFIVSWIEQVGSRILNYFHWTRRINTEKDSFILSSWDRCILSFNQIGIPEFRK